jgi:hypothetical protein
MPISAFGAEKSTLASNGVEVTISGDEFDGRIEYTSPMTTFGEHSFFLVAKIRKNGEPAGPVIIAGYVFYKGEWRQYDAANFRGGESAEAIFNDRDVVTCSGSGNCTLSEGFRIFLSKEQIRKYARDGFVDLKLKASASSQEPIIRVPLKHIEAIMEVGDS